jgi:hypothetical protein
MPRNISFALTTDQIRKRTKWVTRRTGWEFLQPGDVLQGVVRGMGLKKGEKVQKLSRILILRVSREPLSAMLDDYDYGKAEANLEGFPELDGEGFVKMFCMHGNCTSDTVVTRISFDYLD